MYATRGELDIALDSLRAQLPDLVDEFTVGGEFWEAFKAYSDVIIGDASPPDREYVEQQIDAMLQQHGMPPLDD
jgi:hypothetical protein